MVDRMGWFGGGGGRRSFGEHDHKSLQTSLEERRVRRPAPLFLNPRSPFKICGSLPIQVRWKKALSFGFFEPSQTAFLSAFSTVRNLLTNLGVNIDSFWLMPAPPPLPGRSHAHHLATSTGGGQAALPFRPSGATPDTPKTPPVPAFFFRKPHARACGLPERLSLCRPAAAPRSFHARKRTAVRVLLVAGRFDAPARATASHWIAPTCAYPSFVTERGDIASLGFTRPTNLLLTRPPSRAYSALLRTHRRANQSPSHPCIATRPPR